MLSDRIRKLRQERNWTQTQLAEKLGIHQKQISAYERSVNLPATDILIRLAEAFDVSLDYLAFEAEGRPARVNVQDKELLRRIETLDRLPEAEKKVVLEVMDLVILKSQFRSLIKS